MKLRTLRALSLSIVSLSLLSSCDAFFNSNLFKEAGLGQESASSLAAKDSTGLYEAAYTESGKPSAGFYETLKTNPDTKAAVLGTLQTGMASTDPKTAQQSAILYADIGLHTSGASDLVAGCVSAIGNLPSSDAKPEELKAFVQSLIPVSLNTEDSFKTAISALMAAQDTYTTLGEELGSTSDRVLPTATYGNAAQSALLSAFISGIKGPEPEKATIDTAAVLWDILQGTNDGSAISFTSPDMGAGSALGNICAAGGIDLSKLGQ
jgi:hypothetical protein